MYRHGIKFRSSSAHGKAKAVPHVRNEVSPAPRTLHKGESEEGYLGVGDAYRKDAAGIGMDR